MQIRQAAVAGIGETDYSRDSGRSELVLSLQAISAALDDAALKQHDVDGLVRWSVDTSGIAEVAANLGVPDLAWFGGVSQAANVGAALVANTAAAIDRRTCIDRNRIPHHGRQSQGNLANWLQTARLGLDERPLRADIPVYRRAASSL